MSEISTKTENKHTHTEERKKLIFYPKNTQNKIFEINTMRQDIKKLLWEWSASVSTFPFFYYYSFRTYFLWVAFMLYYLSMVLVIIKWYKHKAQKEKRDKNVILKLSHKKIRTGLILEMLSNEM